MEESYSNEIFVAVPKMLEENLSSKIGALEKSSLYVGSPFLVSVENDVVNVENYLLMLKRNLLRDHP